MARLSWLLSGGLGGAEGWGARAGWGVTMANGAVLLSGAKPPLQTEDFSSRWNWATPAGPRRRLPCDMPPHPAGCSHCWISTGVRDESSPSSHPPPGCRAPRRRCRGCPALHQRRRCTGRTMAGAVPACVAVSGTSVDGCHPAPRTTACSESVVSKPRATGLDARQTEEHFQDSPGRELVTASSSAGVPGGPRALRGVRPLCAGLAGPSLCPFLWLERAGCRQPELREEHGAGFGERASAPVPPSLAWALREVDAARATPDWHWIGTGLGPD